MSAALFIIALLLTSGLELGRSAVRGRRSVLELSGLVKCGTGRSALAYLMYGCYCGLGGEGWPRDKADWCCHKHDCCYAQAEERGCYTTTEKYKWSCDNYTPNCGSVKERCEKMLCMCDREAARCLKRAPYNLNYAAWPDFMCGADLPTCAYY